MCKNTPILDAWRGSESASVQIASNNVLCHHNKRLMGYFEFLYGSWIIWLPLNIPEKSHYNISSKIPKRQRLITFILVNTIQCPHALKNNIYHSNKLVPPPFFHSDTNPVFGHILIHSFDKTHALVVTVELIWLLPLNILPTTNKFPLGWQDSEEAM